MSGDTATVIIAGVERDTVLARSIEALGRFPTTQPWVLIGGIAVFLRLGLITRPTADADTVARSQADLIAALIDNDITSVVSGGDIQIQVNNEIVDIDVMDLADDPLPPGNELRVFALARRCALTTAEAQHVMIADTNNTTIASSTIPVATIAALTALKTVSMVRRPHSKHPHKVGSDIHDLVRLINNGPARDIAETLANFNTELATWVESEINRAFGHDLKYTILRLRKHDRSAAAVALRDEDIEAALILADALHQLQIDT